MAKRNIQIALPVTGEEEWQAVRDSIFSGWLTQGPKVAEFEKVFAGLHQARHAIATTSCTTGLHLALVALGVGEGDEVIVPAFTWVATANVILYCGAKPVFVDVDPVTFNLDVAQVASKITPQTKAIIPVHLFGLCADIDLLRQSLPGHVRILEDAACASGASLNGVSAGAMGDAGVFSFHPRKSITTGEGGMITTNDDALAERMIMLRNHGASISEEQRHHGPKPYLLPEFDQMGFNYRMTDLQGSVGLVQIKKLKGFIEERARWADFYRKKLGRLNWLRLPQEPENGRHGWQSFVCFVDETKAPMGRNDLMEVLQEKGVSTRPGTHAVHMLAFYRERFGLKPEDFPQSRNCDRFSLAIPLHNRMDAEDFEYIVEAFHAL